MSYFANTDMKHCPISHVIARGIPSNTCKQEGGAGWPEKDRNKDRITKSQKKQKARIPIFSQGTLDP